MSDLVKRDVKNTVFIDLFSHDEYRLQLFQTIHPEITDVTADDLPVITIKPVITNHLYNDLAFAFRDKLGTVQKLVIQLEDLKWCNFLLLLVVSLSKFDTYLDFKLLL